MTFDKAFRVVLCSGVVVSSAVGAATPGLVLAGLVFGLRLDPAGFAFGVLATVFSTLQVIAVVLYALLLSTILPACREFIAEANSRGAR